MSALMASALISCLAGLISIPIGTFLAAPVYYLLGLFEWLCAVEQQLPCSVWVAGCPAVWEIVVYYALLACAAVGTSALLKAQLSHSRMKKHVGSPLKRMEQIPRGSTLETQMAQLSHNRTEQKNHRRMAQNQKTRLPQNPAIRAAGNGGKVPHGTPGSRSIRRVSHGTPGSRKKIPHGAPAVLWVIVMLLCVCLMGFHPRTGLTVTCLDVGQGDGALIQLPDGTTCLIDGGSTSVSSLWEYRISQTVKYYGISTIDYVLLSHADSDHISGITEYLKDYLPGFAQKNAHGISLKNLVLPPTADESDFETLIERCRELDISVLRMEAGAVLGSAAASAASVGGTSGTGTTGMGTAGTGTSGTETAGSGTAGSGTAGTTVRTAGSATRGNTRTWSFTCVAPSSSSLSGDKNEDSTVLLLQYGSFRMLFTGDLEGASEMALAASGVDLSCDVLKVGHHGSKGASSDEFLAAVSPAFGIISCGANNTYGHPAAAAVERLRMAGITLYATMECGAMTIRSNGVSYRISGYLATEVYAH